MRSLIIILTGLWSCLGFSQSIKIPNLQTSFVLPSKWSSKENLLDFDFVLLSPFSDQSNTRSTIGILNIGKVNYAKFNNDPKYLEDYQNQKKKWVLKHRGSFAYSKFKTIPTQSSSAIESSFSIANISYIELTFTYFCENTSIQIKGLFPTLKSTDIQIFDSFIEKTKCSMKEPSDDSYK